MLELAPTPQEAAIASRICSSLRTTMRILRIRHNSAEYFARWVDQATARLWTAAPWDSGTETDRLVPIRPGSLLCPIVPSKVVCVGRNYQAHVKELGNEVPKSPLLFLKPPSALLAPGEAIELPPQSERVEHEAEIGVVIGRRVKNATLEEAKAAVFGITCVNDVTARDLQKQDVQFTRAKGFDTFCPCGPWIETDDPLAPRSVTLRVDSYARQNGHSRDMIWPIEELVRFISTVMTLMPGDLVSTGTPEGVGPLRHGDRVELEVEGVGVLTNPVVGLESAGS